MRRPGVATHTSTPFLRSMRCSLMFVPPTTIVVLNPFDDRLKIFASFSICCASSRVGAMTMAKGPSPRLISGCWRQCWIIGMENAAVLPEPVSAHPRTSRPEQITGMACAWMGVGLSNSLNLMSIEILVSRFMSSKDSIGGGASSVPAGTSTVTSMRLRISSHCGIRVVGTRRGQRRFRPGGSEEICDRDDHVGKDVSPPVFDAEIVGKSGGAARAGRGRSRARRAVVMHGGESNGAGHAPG